MQVKTLLVSALVLLQKVCAVFCCTEYCRNLSSLYLNPVQSLPHQKMYLNCECCITRFLICYVHLDECRAVFTLGADNYFIDGAVFSKMQMVPQQLKSLDNYVWIIVFRRKPTHRDKIILNNSNFCFLNVIVCGLLFFPDVIVGRFAVFSVRI
jgi:hypothetical protein